MTKDKRYFQSCFYPSPVLRWRDPCWGCEPIISLCKDPGNIIRVCQHFDNDPLSFGHNYRSGSAVGNAGEWPAEITLCFCSISLSLEWLGGHLTWRHGGRLVVTQQSSILEEFQVCRQKGRWKMNIRVSCKNLLKEEKKLHASLIYYVFLHDDSTKLRLSGGNHPTKMAFIKRNWFDCISFLCRYSINECPRCFGLLKAGSR